MKPAPHIVDLALTIAGQAEAIARGTVPVPAAAAARLAENVATLKAWIEPQEKTR